MYQLLIKNGTCVNPDSTFTADLAIQDGKISQIGTFLDLPADTVIDATGKYIFPGVIDSHVHLPWPSASMDSVDDFDSGTRAAICGGVTTIIEYIVPDESGRIIPALENEVARAATSAFCDYSFHLIIRKVTEQTLLDMEEAVKRGFPSFKIYTAYTGFRLEDDAILRILQKARDLGALVCFHAEDGLLVNFASEQLTKSGKIQLRYYPQAHPPMADVEATQRVITYARHIGGPIHIVHVNTREGAESIAQARKQGLPVTGETCPQYLTFTEEVYTSGKKEAAYFVLAPLIRAQRDQDALWESISNDGLQTIATDHCPYSSAQKLKGGDDFRAIPGGAGGVETSLPVIYTLGVKSGRINLNRMVELMSTNPARIFGLFPQKGIINIASDADLVIYDPESIGRVDSRQQHSASDHSVYDGITVNGRIDTTILRGTIQVDNGKLVNKIPAGSLLTR